jgi:hypothetical protein
MPKTAEELFQSGQSEESQDRKEAALKCYLNATITATEGLKVPLPNLDLINIAQKALFAAANLLKPKEEPPKIPTQIKAQKFDLVIPSSPWKIKQANLIALKSFAELKYNQSLDQQSAPELSYVRELLQNIEVSKLEIKKLEVRMNILKNTIDYWAPEEIALHISYVSRNLFKAVDIKKDVMITSFDRVSVSLERVFGFQEYLYGLFNRILLSTCQDRIVVIVDHVINILQNLFYIQHNIASTQTLLAVLVKHIDLVKQSGEAQKKVINNLLVMFDVNVVGIHIEVLNDMLKVHPVTSHDTMIVPFLQVFVEESMVIYGHVFGARELELVQTYLKVLQACQYSGGSSEIQVDDEILHWLLSQAYDSSTQRPFWKSVADSRPEMVVTPEGEMEFDVASKDESAVDEYDPFEDDILKRLDALQSPKKTFN